jgi:hypothetical protein
MASKIGSRGRFAEAAEEDMVAACMACLRKVGVGEETRMRLRRDGRGMGCGGGEGGKEKKDRASPWAKEGDGWRLRMEMLRLCGEDEDVSRSESGGCSRSAGDAEERREDARFRQGEGGKGMRLKAS